MATYLGHYQDGEYTIYVPGTGMGPAYTTCVWIVPGTYTDVD